jgi:hypothetical protein
MIAIHEISQLLWVDTPHGTGQALFLIDYGPHHNTIWVISMKEDGVVRHYDSNHIRIEKNHTLEFNMEK